MKSAITRVREIEQQRLTAMLAKDISVLKDLLDEKLIYVHSTGQCMTKDEYLTHVLEPGFDYLSIEATPSWETIGPNGTVVLVQGVAASIRKPSTGDPVALELTVLTVWCPSPDGWRLLSSISRAVPERRK
jgi:hypothetical protein